MKTYACNAVFSVGKYLGEVKANSAQEALDKALAELDIDVSVCHQCARALGDFNFDVLTVDNVDDDTDSATTEER